MAWTVAPVAVCSLVIGAAGVAKLARPLGTAQALRDARLPLLDRAGPAHATAIGTVEVLAAAAALAWGNRATVAAIVVAQLLFAAFAARLLAQRGGAGTCGCFGSTAAPVHPIHIVLNVVLAIASASALVRPAGPLRGAFASGAGDGVAFLVCALVATWAVIVAFTVLPEVLVAAAVVRTDGDES